MALSPSVSKETSLYLVWSVSLWTERERNRDNWFLIWFFHLCFFLEYSFSELSGENDSADVNAFFADKDVSASLEIIGVVRLLTDTPVPFFQTSKFSMSLKQGLDSITASSSWLKRDGEDVKEWLKAEGYLKWSQVKLWKCKVGDKSLVAVDNKIRNRIIAIEMNPEEICGICRSQSSDLQTRPFRF